MLVAKVIKLFSNQAETSVGKLYFSTLWYCTSKPGYKGTLFEVW